MGNKTYMSPFPEAGIAAFQRWWAMQWQLYASSKLNVGIIGSTADLRRGNDIWHNQKLPTMLITPARMELNPDRGGGASRFQVLATGVDTTTGKVVIRRMAPVRMGLTCEFRTDDYKEVNAFTQMLINSYPGTVFFLEDDTGFRVECRVYLDNGVDLPMQAIEQPGALFVLNMVISMTTVVGTREEQGLIRSIEVRFKEGTGPSNITLSVDAETGKVIDLEELELTYTGPFDSTSSQWKGI